MGEEQGLTGDVAELWAYKDTGAEEPGEVVVLTNKDLPVSADFTVVINRDGLFTVN